MRYFGQTSCFLWHRWLEFLRDVDIAEIVLSIQIVYCQPFHFGYFLILWQFKRKVLVEVALQYVGPAMN